MTKSTAPIAYNRAMKILYADLYFFWNLLADYLLCLAAGRLCALRLRRGRYALAALFGASYALALLFPLPPILGAPAARLGAGLLMGLIAFGGEERPLPCMLTLLGVSAAFGGALYALSELGGGSPRLSFRLLLASFLVIYGLIKLFSRLRCRLRGSPRSEIRLRFLAREVSFSALVDSGNAARDPATGLALLIASPAALAPLFGALAPLLEELPPVELLEALSHDALCKGKLRLVPFRSLGGGGLLPVFRPEALWVDGKRREDLLVALSREARGEGFDAIL